MAVNRVTFTINSRQYTVVAEESVEYIARLGNHINEKVESVLRGGQNIMGERPIVLAALNICDEYFKALDENDILQAKNDTLTERNQTLKKTVSLLTDELEQEKSGQISIDEAALRAEIEAGKNELDEAGSQIKFLEGKIDELEKEYDALKKKYDEREQEMLEMIEKG